MSHNPETAPYSSSPSRSSLTGQQRPSRSLLPSPHFEESQSGSLANEEAIEASAAVGGLVDFHPFFALIENPSNAEHHHPTVHYIFADDDADIITEAACRALAQDEPQHVAEEGGKNELPVPVDFVREHYIILDVEPGEAGIYQVTKADSLSSEWQVMNASISNAPTIDSTDTDSGEGLMLKIEGIGTVSQTEPEEAGKRKKESLQQMVERFDRGLSEIKKMFDKGQS
jgi:hypothetical protein